MARATDASRRLPNKIQLIAMQPMPVPPLHSPPISGKLSDTNQINKEVRSSGSIAWQAQDNPLMWRDDLRISMSRETRGVLFKGSTGIIIVLRLL